MIISIASGKGGTGKTTIAVNLAKATGDGAQLLDCDVEEPNAHLFLKPRFDKTERITLPVPAVDEEKCTRCGTCDDICQFKAIAVIGGDIIMTFPELCHGCGGCMALCPENAITETGRELGDLEIGVSGNVQFVHGRLRVGEAMAPPLIRAVREQAADTGALVIIDAPPGTSCPVVASIKETDFVLLVTEATPFGLNDLKLAVETVKILGIPCGLVINRSDLGDSGVFDYAQQENIPILMEIPFSREWAQTYSRGDLIVEAFPEWKDAFLKMLDTIKKIVTSKQ